jgi:hypothetical protein
MGPDTQNVLALADVNEDGRGDLREVDVFSGAQTTLLTAVDDLAVSPDGRFVAWMVRSPESAAPHGPEWTLYERSTGAERLLGPQGRETGMVVFGDESVAAWSSGDGEGCCFPYDAKTELITLDTLDAVMLDGLVQQQATLDGVQLLDRVTRHDWTTEVRDVATGEIRRVAGVPDATWVEDDAFMVLEGWGANPRRQTLLRLRPHWFGPEVLLTDVRDPIRIADRQWVSVREADASSCGDLVVVEEGRQESGLVIDERVHARLRPIAAGSDISLVYLACDEAGGRTEVRVAELTVDG